MRLGAKITAVAIVACTGAAIAQQASERAASPTLHELLRVGSTTPSPTIGGTGSAGGTPAAFAAGDKVLPKPDVAAPSSQDAKDEPVLGSGGFGADRTTSMTSDKNTGADPTLHYASVFNPDVLPFKRMSSLDAVTADFALVVARPALQDLPVGGTTDKSRDRFWGSVLVQLEPGKDIPLPSVAPDMRILSYEVKPRARLAFSKDGADNFFVRSDESSASGTYRLVFLADADANYFAASLPAQRYTARLVQQRTPPELQHALPANVRAEAVITLRKIGIDPDLELKSAFNKLVRYFREFKEGDLPVDSGNIYRDLCDTQLGVCRHRAFAFAITARALGIPARYVQNEAHAFTEVWFPERGWMRVDLGGAALRMEVSGADNKTLHRPRAEDPFDKPESYADNYTQLEGNIGGLSTQQISDKRKSLDDAPPSGEYDSVGGSGGGTTDSAGRGGGSADAAAQQDRILPDPGLPTVEADPKKTSIDLEVTLADAAAYRGDTIHVEGRVSATGKAVRDHTVQVFLAPAGKAGDGSIPIGTAVTGPDGLFRQDFAVPAGMDLATYEIYLSTNADAYFNGAVSN